MLLLLLVLCQVERISPSEPTITNNPYRGVIVLPTGDQPVLAGQPIPAGKTVSSQPQGQVVGMPQPQATVLPSEETESTNQSNQDKRKLINKRRIGFQAAQTIGNVDSFDHSRFCMLLRRFVNTDGMVAYANWKRDPNAMQELYEYLMLIGAVDTQDTNASAAGELSFYINAYNALVLYGILQEYPTISIQRHNLKRASYRIFDDLELWIDGDYMSLNRIEHEIVRQLGDPRIHFALVCAAKGCPKLRAEAYRADLLETQLTENACHFFAQRDRFQVSRLTGRVYLSPILSWFREDFGATDAEVINTIMPYLPDHDRQWLSRHPNAKISYLGYDWGLNDRDPSVLTYLGATPFSVFAATQPYVRPITKLWRKKKSDDASEPEPPAGQEAEEMHSPQPSNEQQSSGTPSASPPASMGVPAPPQPIPLPGPIVPQELPATPSAPVIIDPSPFAPVTETPKVQPNGTPQTLHPPMVIEPTPYQPNAAPAPQAHSPMPTRSSLPAVPAPPRALSPKPWRSAMMPNGQRPPRMGMRQPTTSSALDGTANGLANIGRAKVPRLNRVPTNQMLPVGPTQHPQEMITTNPSQPIIRR